MNAFAASDVQIFLGNNPVPLRGVSVSYAMRSARAEDDIAVPHGEYKHECSFTVDGSAFRKVLALISPPPMGPERRVSRSGRPLYGLHPSFGRQFWTARPDDKLERRRIRSRVAARIRAWRRGLSGEAVSA